ncbi:AbrB/MazE/SpoVT family DNA-binding domain-containing protein [Arsenicitalea aurantiaca]|uniref:AbrB/MazE/SpoVT family DNA-binding domain-containing protein n=1 Tax=Arsenicitalea aurantiaca TaxID=1783274 RepID=A0A433XAQ9_9HYPH|nr:AbrB/MazE/SpoVT family DNA-binding domain-containing protein [Arsenicitalea aurantiaca]
MQARVRLQRTSGIQVIELPPGFEVPGTEAVIRRDGHRLIVEPVERPSLRDVLAGLEPLAFELPERDEGLLSTDQKKC